MVTAVINSDLIINDETIPKAMNAASAGNGVARTISATISVTTEWDATEVMTVCKLPASASVKSIRFYADDLGTAGAADLGLYTGTSSSDLTVADDDVYAAAIDLNSAAISNSELAFSARDINLVNNYVYEDAGDSLGDFAEYWLCLTGETADVTAAGDITVIVQYTLD